MSIVDARHYRTLLISPNRLIASEIAPMLAYGLPSAPVHGVPSYPDRTQLADLIRAASPKLCFLDLTSQERGLDVLQDIHSLAPNLPVVVMLGAVNPDLVLQCLRQGAMDFLIRPFTTDQLDACVAKIARVAPAPRGVGSGKVISVMPVKGSSGATTVATNLAYQCIRLGIPRVLLGDLDPVTGTVSFLLKLQSAYSFMDVLSREDSLDADLWKQMTVAAHGFDVILGPEVLVDSSSDLASAAPIVDFAQAHYDAIILDCGGVYGPWNLSVAHLSDELLLVTTNEVVSMFAAQRALMYLDSQRVAMDKVKLVVNRYQKVAGLQSEHFGQAFDVEVFETIPTDAEAVQKSLMEGKPIPFSSQIGKSLSAMAERLLPLQMDMKKSTEKAGGLLSSFFR